MCLNMTKFSDQQLTSYLDESLAADQMATIEDALRENEDLRNRLAHLVGRREAGVHGLGEIWQRNRLSCPTRSQLGSYLLGALSKDKQNYFDFHLKVVGCRLCNANLEDLRAQQTEQSSEVSTRRRKYFQTSAGYLRQSPES